MYIWQVISFPFVEDLDGLQLAFVSLLILISFRTTVCTATQMHSQTLNFEVPKDRFWHTG